MNLIESIDNHKLTSVSVYGLTIYFIIYLVVLLKENDICVEKTIFSISDNNT